MNKIKKDVTNRGLSQLQGSEFWGTYFVLVKLLTY